MLKRMSAQVLCAQAAEVPAMVLPGLHVGDVGALVGPGGLGKSWWALQLAAGLSRGTVSSLLPGVPEVGRPLAVAYLALEDPVWVLQSRLVAMKRAGFAVGDLCEFYPLRGGAISLFNAKTYQAVCTELAWADVVLIDTLSKVHDQDDNDGLAMRLLMDKLYGLAQFGDKHRAVLFLHHPNKGAVLQGQGSLQQAARGSGVLTDHARWVSYLMTPEARVLRKNGLAADDTSRVIWGVSKQNYGGRVAPQWYCRNAAGVLIPEGVGVEKAMRKSLGGVPAGAPGVIENPSSQFGKNW